MSNVKWKVLEIGSIGYWYLFDIMTVGSSMTKPKKLTLIHLLLPFLIGFAALSFIFRQNSNFQLIIILGALLFYIVFSLIHHYLDKTLTLETIIEYILIAALVVIIVAGGFI